MNQKVLVTGGAGYIGSHVCKELHLNGMTPVVFDNFSLGHREFVKWGPYFEGDIRNLEDLDKAFKMHCPTSVIHFAASAYVGESVQNPSKYYGNNVIGSYNLLEAMRKHSVQNIIFSSSCAVYGASITNKINESHPLSPINPYGNTKKAIEMMIKDFANAYHMRYGILRYFNAAGADPDGEIGEKHLQETHLIPLLIQNALNSKEPFKIFGDSYNTEDGTAIRDFIHVKDLAIAHVNTLKYLICKDQSITLNLGSGKGFSVKEIIDRLQKQLKTNIACEIAEKREGDPPLLIADIQKAQKILLWKPSFSDIETILETACRWHKKEFL
ncbi:MAG TPA: UDP-glucose 4-epimerase GalE [Chlamydiales bacterium]|nr:UDP-glucose 4-epimerase GalE [Chlamydiales bacterium]